MMELYLLFLKSSITYGHDRFKKVSKTMETQNLETDWESVKN